MAAARRLASLLVAAVALCLPVRAQDTVTLNFAGADIEAVAAAVGQMTGRNFVLDPRVKGTVNITSSRPVPVASVYEIFLSALRLQGFTAVESGGVTRILPEADAKLHVRGMAPARPGDSDRILTHVYTLKYESASQLLPVLRPIISPNNTIAVYAANNSLVVTDYAHNLERISRIIDAIDRPGGGDPVVVPLRYAAAADLVETLNRILAEAPGPGAAGAAPPDPRARVFVAPDARTNSVIVRSENPARIARVRSMVEQLDVPTGASGNIHVVYLKNAEATRVAQTLRAILSGEAPAPGAPPVPAGVPAPVAALAASLPPGSSMVQADAASNAVIIQAPEAIFANLKSVIDKLDVRRAQVYVEALVVEVTADKAAEFGIQWQTVPDLSSNETRPIGGTNFGAQGTGTNIIDAARNFGAVGRGLNIGLVRGQVTVPGLGTITNLSVLARALQNDATANILSTPNLLTLDNEEARIVVGQNVPIITGQYAQTGSSTTATPFQTIERRDVGLSLRIKPQISEGGAVRLQIYQEVSSVLDQLNPAGIITNKRSIESTVLVEDGQIVALGGLVQDGANTTVEKVPLLGDIPFLGYLFRYETRRQTKTNLMVFLRPVVWRELAPYGAISAERYRQATEAQKQAKPEAHPVLPEVQAPVLPALPGAR